MLRWLKRLLLCLGGAGVLYVAFARLKPRPLPVAALRTDGAFVEVDGLNIHYRMAGSGPALLLIHGLGANLFAWRLVFDQLAHSFTVYALDLKGHGLSDKPGDGDYSPYAQADLVAHFLEKLQTGPAVVVGQSMGGAVAAALAIRHPDKVKKLVLVAAAGYDPDLHVMPLLAWFARTPVGRVVIGSLLSQRGVVKRMLRACYYDPARICTPEVVNGYYLPLRTPGVWDIIPLLARDIGQTSLGDRIKQIRAPTLIIWGQHDAVLPLNWGYRFQRDIPGSRLEILPACGHCPHEEHPERFIELVRAFALGEAPAAARPAPEREKM